MKCSVERAIAVRTWVACCAITLSYFSAEQRLSDWLQGLFPRGCLCCLARNGTSGCFVLSSYSSDTSARPLLNYLGGVVVLHPQDDLRINSTLRVVLLPTSGRLSAFIFN